MTIAPEIFKAYDIRGIVGKTLTPTAVEAIGHGLGSLAREKHCAAIVIGRDGRLSGPELSKALAAGIDISGAYLDRVVTGIRLARPMKIAIDCGNGSPGAYAPALFKRLGCEVQELFCDVDGAFPNHHPDPSQPENLRD